MAYLIGSYLVRQKGVGRIPNLDMCGDYPSAKDSFLADIMEFPKIRRRIYIGGKTRPAW